MTRQLDGGIWVVVGLGVVLVLTGCDKVLPLETQTDGGDGAVSDGPTDGPTEGTDSLALDQLVVDLLVPDQLIPDLPCHGQTCALGCDHDKNQCKRLKPSNVPDPVLDGFDKLTVPLVDVVIASDTTIKTGTGEITGGVRPQGGQGSIANGVYWNLVSQLSGYPQVSVFFVKSLTIQQGATVTIAGTKALLIYATGDVAINGTLAARAIDEQGVAGGGAGGTFGQAGGHGSACLGGEGKSGNYIIWGSGGGGGGHGASGGTGGAAENGTNPGGTAGQAVGTQSLSPLTAGCGGGAGAGNGMQEIGGNGGGGGGAIQIASNGALAVSGIITAPGAGGIGGLSKHAGGGGGGSGGAILLEAMAISVSGTLATNGGGGGSGGNHTTSNNGTDGTDDLAAAPGGANVGASFQNPGGDGGALAQPQGLPGQGLNLNSGGGGGAAGRIHCNSPNINAAGGQVSPAMTQSATVAPW